MDAITFSDSEFDHMDYRIHNQDDALKNVELKKFYALTAAICEKMDWMTWVPPSKLLKYVVYTYHKKSPLVRKITVISERKKKAMELAGFAMKSAEQEAQFKEFIGQLIFSQHPFVNKLVLTFLVAENDILWLQYVRLFEVWEDAVDQIQNPTTDFGTKSAIEIANHKAKLHANIQRYQDDLNKLAEQLTQQDGQLQNFMGTKIYEDKYYRLITPEDIAKLTPEQLTEAFKQRQLL